MSGVKIAVVGAGGRMGRMIIEIDAQGRLKRHSLLAVDQTRLTRR